MNGSKIKKDLERLFPNSLAEEWDNVGLQVGTFNKDITAILIALDATEKVVDEAIEMNANLILVHHPLLFMPLQEIDIDHHIGKLIEKLVKHNITLYALHTNYDSIKFGMSHHLGQLLGLKDMKPFMMVTENEGYGVLGKIQSEPMTSFINRIKHIFSVSDARFIGNLEDSVQSVALLGGSGKDSIKDAALCGVDLYITGDITYHYAVDAKAMGLNVLDIGHFIESFGLNGIKELLEKEFPIEIFISKRMENPYKKV